MQFFDDIGSFEVIITLVIVVVSIYYLFFRNIGNIIKRDMGCGSSTEASNPSTKNTSSAPREQPTTTTTAPGDNGGNTGTKKVSFGGDDDHNPQTKKTKILEKTPSEMATQEELLGERKNFAKSVIKPNKPGAHHLKNIFAKPLEILGTYTAPEYPKTTKDEIFIKNSFENNFVFSNLKDKKLETTLIKAFEKIIYENEGTSIIQQGDTNADYFYILEKGQVKFVINNKEVGRAESGKSFGELSLLYTSPRAASCITSTTNCVLWRLDQKTFRSILQSTKSEESSERKDLLKGISFISQLQDNDLNKLVDTLTYCPFSVNDHLVKKGEEGDAFYVIKEGSVKVTDITIGDAKYEDQILSKGGYFGERALVTKEPRAANIIATSNGICYKVDATTFNEVLGNLDTLILRADDERALRGIKSLVQTDLDDTDYVALTKLITNHAFPPGNVIVKEGQKTAARLYLVRDGEIELTSTSNTSFNGKFTKGSFFGEDQLLVDQDGDDHDTNISCKYTIKVTSEDKAVIGCLGIADARNMIDTTMIGTGKSKSEGGDDDDDATDIKYNELQRQSILGAGTFGQVWLCTRKGSSSNTPYALKIQSKYELIQNSQAKGVIQERLIMSKLKSQFVISLVASYQDLQRVYLLLKVLQGGELYSLMYPNSGMGRNNGVGEKSAKFYSACILEGLSYMHRRDILYRDLKPENILIDKNGYPVLIDLGFAKIVKSKTFTLCGTPLYIAPEVVMNRGHDKGADHWSLGVLIYEMIVGDTPFYKDGIDQIQLFRNICKASFTFPSKGASRSCSPEAEAIVRGLLTPYPTKRMGSLANGIKGIYNSSFYESSKNGRISFTKLRRKEIPAPWVPNIKDPLDTSNFENWDDLDDKGKQKDPKLTKDQQKLFAEFPQI